MYSGLFLQLYWQKAGVGASGSTQVQPSGSQPLETHKIGRKSKADPSLGEHSIPQSLQESK